MKKEELRNFRKPTETEHELVKNYVSKKLTLEIRLNEIILTISLAWLIICIQGIIMGITKSTGESFMLLLITIIDLVILIGSISEQADKNKILGNINKLNYSVINCKVSESRYITNKVNTSLIKVDTYDNQDCEDWFKIKHSELISLKDSHILMVKVKGSKHNNFMIILR